MNSRIESNSAPPRKTSSSLSSNTQEPRKFKFNVLRARLTFPTILSRPLSVPTRSVIFLSLGSGQTKTARRPWRKREIGGVLLAWAPRRGGFWPRSGGNRSVPPWRLQGPPALPETPSPSPLLPPFTSTLLAIIIRVLWLRFLALFPSLCPPFLSPPSRLFRNISPLALARRATSSLILPTRSLNNADPRNLRRRNRLCVLVISVFGMEARYFALQLSNRGFT